MSPKRIPVDFDQLEWALTDNDGTDSFLDTQSGEVVRISPHLDTEEREALSDQIDDAPR